MRYLRSWILLAALVSALPLCAAADPVDQTDALRPIAAYIANARLQIHADNLAAGGDLARGADVLTRLIETGTLDAPSLSIAYYYRGQARYLQNVLHDKRQQPIDLDLARAALDDFDHVVSAGLDIRNWGISVADTDYEAGVLAFGFLHDPAVAFTHLRRCAEDRHAGCMELVADARLTGAPGLPVDVNLALDWHARVYETGIAYKCAGAFSARSIAEITYFTGVRQPAGNALDWLARANDLLDELTARGLGRDPCGRSAFALTEFLVRLAQGDRRDDILAAVFAEDPEFSVLVAAAHHFLGTLDDDAYRAIVEHVDLPHRRCRPYLYGVWFAALSGRAEAARASFNGLSALGEVCAKELLFVRKFGLAN